MDPSDSGSSRWLEMNARARQLARELYRLRRQNPVDLQSYRAARADLAACLLILGPSQPRGSSVRRPGQRGDDAPSAV